MRCFVLKEHCHSTTLAEFIKFLAWYLADNSAQVTSLSRDALMGQQQVHWTVGASTPGSYRFL